ncbi:MAG: phosphatidylinositol-4-phosphate 5-kinase, partial [Prevotella sp.]|nr:phosphatidylinositol-4-phosphate 5-kinase [Prevotella sp.]
VEGQFKEGHPEGECIGHLADGSKFKAQFKNGVRHGAAIEENKEGLRFEGSYSEGKRHGDFVEKDRNGSVVATGTYDKGYRKTNK